MDAKHAIEPKALAKAAQAPTAVLVLSYARVVPFVAMALIIALISPSPAAASALAAEIGYGAVLLSFLGGVRWGAAIKTAGDAILFRPLTLLMLPTLFSWCVLFMASATALAALMAGFLLVTLADRASVRRGLAPAWQSGLDLPPIVMTELALGASLVTVLIS